MQRDWRTDAVIPGPTLHKSLTPASQLDNSPTGLHSFLFPLHNQSHSFYFRFFSLRRTPHRPLCILQNSVNIILWHPFVSRSNLSEMIGTDCNLIVLIFLSNSTLALLLGIPYSEQRRDIIFHPNRPVFGRGEVVQIITSSMTVVLLFCL